MYECNDCGANILLPVDSQNNEIIGCQDCGLDFIIQINEIGFKQILELSIEGEDWGE
jgi:DNA-directed RNA polymerase subunit RPC12/RpoP